ncbi:MAG TPA: hypothetical protein VFC63_19525 [Blastocatellia bacterium]|nr:hypothetical protein [Blastocatellia bacterium]
MVIGYLGSVSPVKPRAKAPDDIPAAVLEQYDAGQLRASALFVVFQSLHLWGEKFHLPGASVYFQLELVLAARLLGAVVVDRPAAA